MGGVLINEVLLGQCVSLVPEGTGVPCTECQARRIIWE